MTIVVMSGRYYLPFMDGFKEINREQALYLYEQGCFEEVETYEHD